MSKEPSNSSPLDLPSWMFDPQLTVDKPLLRLSLARFVKYKGLSFKDIKLDIDLIRNVVAFHGLESVKYRAINPLALRFTHKIVNSIYDALRNHLESSDQLQQEQEDLVCPEPSTWYP